MNEELIRKTMAKIREVGESGWDQSAYVSECGTTSCFAGWALRLSGYGVLSRGPEDGFAFHAPESGRKVLAATEAAKLLGLPLAKANEIFLFMGESISCGSEDCRLCAPNCVCGSGVDELARHVEHVTGLEGL